MTVAGLAKKRGNDMKTTLYELSCQAQDSIFENQQQQAYYTMFGAVTGDESSTDDDESAENEENTNDGESNDEEDPSNCYYDALSPEDF